MLIIYVIGSGRGPKKIGVAREPQKRMRSIQTGNGHELKLLYSRSVSADIAKDIEGRVHWLLRGARTHGEWFNVTLEVAKEAIEKAAEAGGHGEKLRFGVGRPAMNVKPTVVRLPQGMDARIDAVLKAGEKRADLIRAAIERELRRREHSKA